MAEHIWSVLCSKHLIEPQTNLMSLFEVVEKITIVGGEERLAHSHAEGKRGFLFPVQMEVVTYWLRSNLSEPESSEGRVIVKSPEGEVVLSQEFMIDLQHEEGGYRHIVTYGVFPLSSFGTHWFVVEQRRSSKAKVPKWSREARIPLEMIAGK
jgi:hypothetical protein